MRLTLLLLLLPSLASAQDVLELPALDATDLGVTSPELTLQAHEALTWGGGAFVHVQQSWAGLPVHLGRLVASYDGDGVLRETFGTPVQAGPLSLDPSVSAQDARRTATAWADDELDLPTVLVRRVETGLVQDGPRTHLAWVIDLFSPEPLAAYRVYVDAHSGHLITSQQRLWTARGDVYATNPDASELQEVEFEADGGLSNDYARVVSCSDFNDQNWTCEAKESQAAPDGDGNFFYDPDPTSLDDPFAEVQMFWHLNVVTRWFEDEFGFRTDFGLTGRAVEGIVNFELANAFYGDADGDGLPEVAFGQSAFADFAYDADVVYHEYGHAVFGSVVDTGDGRYDEYGRLVAPGALNEGSADLFSVAITQDPHLGEYAGSSFLGGDAIRELDDDRHCPTDIYGESHVDGEIWAAFGWNVVDDDALGPRVAAHLVFGALNRWSDEVTFGSAGQSLLESAADLLETGFVDPGQYDGILGHIEKAGLDDCGRVVRLDEGQENTQLTHVRRSNNDGSIRGRPLATQFSLDAPEGTQALRFIIDDQQATDEGIAWRVYVRRGEHVVHELTPSEQNPNFVRPTVAEFDFDVLQVGVGVAVELTPDSEPPLEPGATYYFAVWSDGAEDLSGRVSAEVTVRGEADIVPVVAQGANGDDLGGAGCSGCASSVGGGAGLLLLPLLAVGRRRR